MKRDFQIRKLSFERLEPRTLLAADFVAGYLMPGDLQTGSLIPVKHLPIQEFWTGAPVDDPGGDIPEIKVHAASLDGWSGGPFYLRDSMVLRIQFGDAESFPWDAGDRIVVIVSFDAGIVNPEGSLLFPDGGECHWDADGIDGQLTICLRPAEAQSLVAVDIPFLAGGIGVSSFEVSVAYWDSDGAVGTTVVELKGSADFIVKEERPAQGPIAVDRPVVDRGVLDVPSNRSAVPALRSPGLLGVRPLTPRASIAKSLEDDIPLTLASEKRSVNSESTLTVRILRRPAPHRAAPEWGLEEDATASLFRPMELHDLERLPVINEEMNRRATRLASARDRGEKDVPPTRSEAHHATDKAASWSRLSKPSFLSGELDMPGPSEHDGNPPFLRLITADEIDRVLAAWQAPPDSQEEQP